MAEKTTSSAKGNGDATKAQPPKVAEPARFEQFEQVNMRWRHVAKAGTRTEDLTHGDYLGGIASKLADFDLLDVFSEDRRHYWQCLVVQGGRDGIGRTGSGRARMIVLPGYPIELPAVDRLANNGLPVGYSIEYDGFRRVHIPMWGSVPLNADGMPIYEDARALVVHHASQAASVPPRAPQA